MTSAVAIANRALYKLGELPISAFGDTTKQARTINSMFAIVRDDELRAHRWSFSISRAQLAASVTTPLFGYSNAFPLPNDCLRVLMVGNWLPGVDFSDYRNGTDSQEWVIEGRDILAYEDGLVNLRYIRREEDTTKWDSSFVESFACRLAAECCETLTQSSNKRDMAWNEYQQSIQKARRAGAIELPPRPIADDTWVIGRVRV